MGIFAKNREEWAVIDIACIRSSCTIVPFFDSLGPSALTFVLNQTEVETMCIDAGGFDHLLKVKPECAHLKTIVTFDDLPEEKLNKAKELGIKVYHYNDILNEGKKHPDATFREPTPETTHMFCYTSGTTGDPKAAILTHSCFVPVGKTIDFFSGGLFPEDVAISYLPYAHVFE